jgi:hypothetical protein
VGCFHIHELASGLDEILSNVTGSAAPPVDAMNGYFADTASADVLQKHGLNENLAKRELITSFGLGIPSQCERERR